MLLLNASGALLFFTLAYSLANDVKFVPDTKEHYNISIIPEPESITNLSNTKDPIPITTTLKPTTSKPSSTSTTQKPNITTTTGSPNTTTSTTPTPTTPNPNITTTVSPIPTTPEPSPEPAPARNWDGPSFLGGMVLAFGIVAVGFVGYRFFYLGRGGAYHTL